MAEGDVLLETRHGLWVPTLHLGIIGRPLPPLYRRERVVLVLL